ncbi:MAG: TRL domain-containing protein [Candidatus Gastranaerophilaceae bacterium]|nr:TRL domain-containing protein [Candidatus Gastranaerophilaceae bacterium]
MKKLVVLLGLVILGTGIGLKASAYEPWGIGIYNGTKEAMDYATPGATLGSRTGAATCRTVLGIVNWGDCSIKSAMKNGRVSRVTAADWEKKYIVVYGEKTLRVYGN